MRSPLIVGNWKLNGDIKLISELLKSLCKTLKYIEGCNIAIAPPEIYLYLAKLNISANNIKLCAQNVDINLYGAFTGDTSAYMLKDVGVKYVIIGHSERRIGHKETDDLIAQKFNILKKVGLVPILCIGETKEEKENGQTKDVCTRQIDIILNTQGIVSFKNTVIAYEPIWAIGSGLSATPNEVQKIHQFIREYITKQDEVIAQNLVIQYGGSVNDNNVEKLLTQPDVDGVLVGGASLQPTVFSNIVQTAVKIKKHREY